MQAMVEVAATTRKKAFHYSGLCGLSGVVDAVKSTIPKGFKLTKPELIQDL